MDSSRRAAQKLDMLRRAQYVSAVIFDCDGVLTDGRTRVDSGGNESVAFSVVDGTGIKWLRRAGIKTAIITGRGLAAVRHKAEHLGMNCIIQNMKDKNAGLKQDCEQLDCGPEEICYVGDDMLDLPILRRVRLAVAVSCGAPQAACAAHYVTAARGGNGAAREVAELIIKAKGLWQEITNRYYQ